MIYAYMIEDVRALSDLFKVGVGPKRSAQGQFTAYRVRHPESKARRALIVTGVPKSGLDHPIPPTIGHEIRVSVEGPDLYLYDDDGEKQPLEVFGFESSPNLVELIEPLPWRHEAEHDIPVIFWLNDESMMPEIVRRSLYLNNDRVQLARVSDGDRSPLLVRIESPSYYLMAWCEEQEPGAIEMFYPMTEGPGLYVQWRHEHPLADLWRRAWSEQTDRWVFFPADAHRRHVAKPEWESIYELTDFTVALEGEDEWDQISADIEHFEISLKLTPRHEPADTETLLLHERDRPKLEDFLALSDEADIEKLEISVQTDGDARWYFVREKHRGDGIMLVELGGRSFSRYKGFDNLYMPSNLVLEPQLRRDQYKRLFKLTPSTLTFVVPDESADEAGGELIKARQIKVRKSSFEPFAHFVDHVVHFDEEALQSALTRSVFDLDVYKTAPSRPGLGRPEGAERKTPSKPKTPKPKQGTRGQRRAQRAAQRQRRMVERAQAQAGGQQAAEDAPATPTELELIETDIERDIVRQGPLVELWQELLEVKHQRGKWLEASVCAVEGMWSQTFPDGSTEAGEAEAATFPPGFITAISSAGGEPEELAVVAELLEKLQSGDADIAFIMQAAGKLRAVETKLGKKVRWLAWREVLTRTQDVRQQEEVREAILDQLNAKGLETHDVPTFIRERILKDPDLELDDDDMEDGSDTSYVLQNVEAIEDAIGQLQTFKIREASLASLARIFAGMGLSSRARDLIERSLSAMEQDLDGEAGAGEQRAWHQRLRDFFAPTGGGRSDGGKAPERWHVWVALNAWLVYQRVEPARAEDAKAAYDLLFAQLQSYEKDELRKTQESLEARVGQTNVAEFLAVDTRSFFSSRDLPDEMNKVVKGLRQSHKKGEEKKVNELVARGIQLAAKDMTESNSPSLETVARLILEMVETLRKLKWDKEQRPVQQFEEFVKALPKEPRSRDSSRLYFAVLHCAAARALMDLGREKDAMRMLVDIMKWVGEDYMQVLDFVDLVKKEVLLAVELAPRNQRTDALRHLMETLIEQERLEIGDDPDHPGVGFQTSFQAYELIQMIDHTLEAAISNEKLVLRRLRDFEEREESRIRYWIQRDQPATP
jgi:hypothetical protein